MLADITRTLALIPPKTPQRAPSKRLPPPFPHSPYKTFKYSQNLCQSRPVIISLPRTKQTRNCHQMFWLESSELHPYKIIWYASHPSSYYLYQVPSFLVCAACSPFPSRTQYPKRCKACSPFPSRTQYPKRCKC